MNAETDILERADAAFAEALAEPLVIREHETGKHSKRDACHTLVLARRFISLLVVATLAASDTMHYYFNGGRIVTMLTR